jgi:hypothetical protein
MYNGVRASKGGWIASPQKPQVEALIGSTSEWDCIGNGDFKKIINEVFSEVLDLISNIS